MTQRNSFYTLVEELCKIDPKIAELLEDGDSDEVSQAIDVAEAEADDRLLTHMEICYGGRSPLATAAALAFVTRGDYLEPPSAKASDEDRLKLAKHHCDGCEFNGERFWNAPTYEQAVDALRSIAADVADAYQNLQLAYASKHGPIVRKDGCTDEQADLAMQTDLKNYRG